MNRVKFITLFTIMACLLIAIPACFAADDICMNDTLAGSDEDILADDCYFDVNSDTDGNGTADNPYNNFTAERIKSGCDNHLASGEYNLTSDISIGKASFIGNGSLNTILNGNGHTLLSEDLTFTNITLKNIKILSSNKFKLSASNAVFKDCSDDSGKGGVICSSHVSSMTFANCTFENNSASYGGAIYILSGRINLSNCTFENNSARYGGAIYAEKSLLEGFNSTFRNNAAVMLGGAVTSVNSNKLMLDDSSFAGNIAGFEGGAVYSYFGNSLIFNSSFEDNFANAGGALFIDSNREVNITGNRFKRNTAYYTAGAVFLLTNVDLNMSDNTYEDNSAIFNNDLLETDIPFAFVGEGDYEIYIYNSTFTGDLPSYYSLRDEGYVTPVKDQGSGGNCWSFAALAAIESCILKASGITYDLSEGNMKNLMSWYSDFGWNMEPNRGGYDKMAVGYLTGWLGPINETDDPYDPSNEISLIYNALTHVQNVVFLTRSDYTDNDNIKRAIMDYGGVATSIAWYGNYRSGKNYYCNNPSETQDKANHAVTIVGWDDNYSRNNFSTAAPGDGAWIIKNSWGTSGGDNGFYYVSYYDTKIAKPGKNGATYTFILNDTLKFDKNYQYDLPGKTDIFLNFTDTVWYKNVFNATDDEYLAAVSTYFYTDTNWTVYIYVNGSVKLTQSGFSKESYSTINLNQLIPLSRGDIFEVVFKISVDGDACFPISERISLINDFYTQNISFVSYDGENWSDLYDLEWKYPEHTYNSQVACIKAFTVFDVVNTTLKLTSDLSGGFKVKAQVLNQYGRPVTGGNVTFDVNGEIYSVGLVNGLAVFDLYDSAKDYNITAYYKNVGYIPSMDNISLTTYQMSSQLNLTVDKHNPVNIIAHVVNDYGQPIDCGNVTFILDGETYVVNVTDGDATLTKIFKDLKNHTVSAVFNSIYYYNSSNTQHKDFNVSLINTSVDITFNNEMNPISICADVIDQYGKEVNYGNVTFIVEGNEFCVNVSNGEAWLNYTFASFGSNNVKAIYRGLDIYNSSEFMREGFVKTRTFINLDVEGSHNPVTFTAYVIDEHNETVTHGNMAFVIDDVPHYYQLTNGTVSFNHSFVNFGLNAVSVIFYAFSYYDSCEILENVSVISKTSLNMTVTNEYDPVNISVTVSDEYGRVLDSGNVTFIVDNTSYTVNVINGAAYLTYTFKKAGLNSVRAIFNGLQYYESSEISSNVNVKSTIVSAEGTKTLNSKYQFGLLDSNGTPLANVNVTVNVNSKEYKLTTDNNGNAAFDITFNPGKYSITITNPINNETKTQTINVVKRIAENKDISMYYGAGTSYKVKVLDDNGNIAKGVKVTFTIAGKSYTRTTDSRGYASFKITQKPGKYTVTAEYKGFKVSNKITVKTIIVAKNIKVKKGKTIKFTAKLLSKNGKALKNKKITFKFKGKKYMVKTNKKGKAILKITKKYKAGKYTITSSYGKLTVKNTIKIKK